MPGRGIIISCGTGIMTCSTSLCTGHSIRNEMCSEGRCDKYEYVKGLRSMNTQAAVVQVVAAEREESPSNRARGNSGPIQLLAGRVSNEL